MKYFWIIPLAVVVLVGVWYWYTPKSPATDKSDLIRVTKPQPNMMVVSPLDVRGVARGFWFFEASFPVRLLDANSVTLGSGIAQANGEWMTEDFVPFTATIVFTKPLTSTGVLVLQKDNPSGLPEHDDELRIPVQFDLNGLPVTGGDCYVGGCSAQICSDDPSAISTCEWREEYACYKTALCERQQNGRCGWTMTKELRQCLDSSS